MFCLGCKSTKTEIVYSEVQKGNQLDKIPEIKLDSFLRIWIQKTEDERGLSVRQLYKDSVFSYFWARWKSYYKIQNKILLKVDYKSINGDSVRALFYDHIIPTADKKKQEQCSTALIDFDFKYDFLEQYNTILIQCHYKVKCELLITVVSRDYVAKYDIKSKGN